MTDYRTARFHDGERYIAVLAREGRTRLHITFRDDSGIVHRALPREDARHLSILLHHGKPYSIERMVRRLSGLGHTVGITQAAKNELTGAVTRTP